MERDLVTRLQLGQIETVGDGHLDEPAAVYREAHDAFFGREVDPFELELVVVTGRRDRIAEELGFPEARRGRNPVTGA